jgi:hypothetical protein
MMGRNVRKVKAALAALVVPSREGALEPGSF